MTPQSNFMIVAPVRTERRAALEHLLASMTSLPGMAKPDNPIVPFGVFENLHYARFVILDDQTLGDFERFGVEIPQFPVTLAFLGDCDGPAEHFLVQLAKDAAEGLRRIFGCCDDFAEDTDLLAWMKARSQPTAASYVNWIGRTVKQVREEAALRDALRQELASHAASNNGLQEIRKALKEWLRSEQKAEKLPLSLPEPTPMDWRVRNLLHLAILPAAGFMLVIILIILWCRIPLLLLPLVLFVVAYVWCLRRAEKSEPEIIVRPPPDQSSMLARLEDHDVTNQFTVVGSVKPTLLRRATLAVVLYLIDYGARHVYNKGHLGRIRSIHFARWAYLNDKKRVLFASNYDGSLESYMDDFINKVGWGLNMVFSNGVGYPRTHWLVSYGSKEEQKFKYTLRRHQLPTQVWYKAYPGLTAFDLARNSRVREGIERASMTNDEIRDWLRDL